VGGTLNALRYGYLDVVSSIEEIGILQ